jgi:nickel/cobalt transporter (NicO) family protein
MTTQIGILLATAASLGFIHTLLGPDHYVPFIALAKARKWNLTKTMVITLLCGIGHVLSSIILGFTGVALGIAVFRLETVESLRGEVAGWFLIAFGFTYAIWGLHQAIRGKPHHHAHVHEDGQSHVHDHSHRDTHAHVHTTEKDVVTPWILFTIFVFGPCEPLIPLVMYPAAQHNLAAVALVASVFGTITIGTMLAIVALLSMGLKKIPLQGFERYAHMLAGITIILCGGAIKFLGL